MFLTGHGLRETRVMAREPGEAGLVAVRHHHQMTVVVGIQVEDDVGELTAEDVKFTFTDQRPKGYWEALQASEYGFWANVNPQVPHPRWSQAAEELIGTGERRPTLLFNGYADYVANLYQGLESERLWA